MRHILLRLKPGVSKKAHLISASVLWTSVGVILAVRGSLWLIDEQSGLYIVPAVLFGSIKSLFILDKSAKRCIDRILRLADGSCLGAVYSVKTWLVIVAMMISGYLVRHSSVPLVAVGTVYVAVGWAMFFSSRIGWRALAERSWMI